MERKQKPGSELPQPPPRSLYLSTASSQQRRHLEPKHRPTPPPHPSSPVAQLDPPAVLSAVGGSRRLPLNCPPRTPPATPPRLSKQSGPFASLRKMVP